MNRRNLVVLAAGAICLLIAVIGYRFVSLNKTGAEPTQSTLANSASATKGVSDWCIEHRVPESVCTKCNPELIPAFKAKTFNDKTDWCTEHGLPESHCRLCNPGISFPQEPKETSDWCVEHRVPESVCTKCNPELIPAFKAKTFNDKTDWCTEHGLPESHCRLCNPGISFPQEPKVEAQIVEPVVSSVFFPTNSAQCATDNALIQFASLETADRIGLTVAPALEITQSLSVEAPAEALFDESTTYSVATTIPSSIVRWLVEPGQSVSSGVALAEIESPEMPDLKADFLEALTEFELREKDFIRSDSLAKRKLISAAEAQQADGHFRTAQARLAGAQGLLQACGLSPEDIQLIQSDRVVTSRWLLRASAGGALLERKAPLGEQLAAGSTIALVGNPMALWIVAHVRAADLPLFHIGQVVEFASDGDALERTQGRVIWISQFIDPLTRSATVRAEIVNSSPTLTAHQFGRLTLSTSSQTPTFAVPRDAVQWEGCCNVVFVREAPDRYRPHKVTVARGDRGYYNISAGLKAGEMVVVNGSYLLKTELKKGSLGAGCCDVAPKS